MLENSFQGNIHQWVPTAAWEGLTVSNTVDRVYSYHWRYFVPIQHSPPAFIVLERQGISSPVMLSVSLGAYVMFSQPVYGATHLWDLIERLRDVMTDAQDLRHVEIEGWAETFTTCTVEEKEIEPASALHHAGPYPDNAVRVQRRPDHEAISQWLSETLTRYFRHEMLGRPLNDDSMVGELQRILTSAFVGKGYPGALVEIHDETVGAERYLEVIVYPNRYMTGGEVSMQMVLGS